MDVFEIVAHTSRLVNKPRTRQDILTHMMTEVGELALEVQIVEGKSYKDPGLDGVPGESIDVILCAIDMILIDNPSISRQQIYTLIEEKCAKWRHKNGVPN